VAPFCLGPCPTTAATGQLRAVITDSESGHSCQPGSMLHEKKTDADMSISFLHEHKSVGKPAWPAQNASVAENMDYHKPSGSLLSMYSPVFPGTPGRKSSCQAKGPNPEHGELHIRKAPFFISLSPRYYTNGPYDVTCQISESAVLNRPLSQSLLAQERDIPSRSRISCHIDRERGSQSRQAHHLSCHTGIWVSTLPFSVYCAVYDVVSSHACYLHPVRGCKKKKNQAA